MRDEGHRPSRDLPLRSLLRITGSTWSQAPVKLSVFPPKTHPLISHLQTVRVRHTKLQSSVDMLSCAFPTTQLHKIHFITGYSPLGKVPCIFLLWSWIQTTKLSMKPSNYLFEVWTNFSSYRCYWNTRLENQKTQILRPAPPFTSWVFLRKAASRLAGLVLSALM